MKRDVVFDDLKTKILNGTIRPGEKLLREVDLCASYSVARGTIRKSLERLTKEGYLERIKSRGTFVRLPEQKTADRVLSFLIPNPSYLSRNGLNNPFSAAFCGAVRAASEVGWRVETIPFSRTNDNREIDWGAMEHLNENSRLIIFNQWYHTAFDEFLRRKIRIGIIRMFSGASPWDGCFKHWISATLQTQRGAEDAVRMLYASGCRRILNANLYYDDPYNDKTIGYNRAVKALGLANLPMDMDRFQGGTDWSDRIVREIHDQWKSLRFDALFISDLGTLFDLTDDIYKTLALPKTVRILSYRDHPDFLRMNPQISALDENIESAGYYVAKALMQEPFVPQERAFELVLRNRETTGGMRQETNRMLLFENLNRSETNRICDC